MGQTICTLPLTGAFHPCENYILLGRPTDNLSAVKMACAKGATKVTFSGQRTCTYACSKGRRSVGQQLSTVGHLKSLLVEPCGHSTSTQSQTSTVAPTVPAESHLSGAQLTGIVFGGVIAGLFALLLCCCAACYIRKRFRWHRLGNNRYSRSIFNPNEELNNEYPLTTSRDPTFTSFTYA